MKEFLAKNPDAKTAVDQLDYAKPWFATYKTVAVRKAIEDELQAVLSGKKQPKEALVAAQKTGRRDPEALRRADRAEAAARPPSSSELAPASPAHGFALRAMTARITPKEPITMLIAQITDLHVRPRGKPAYGVSRPTP